MKIDGREFDPNDVRRAQYWKDWALANRDALSALREAIHVEWAKLPEGDKLRKRLVKLYENPKYQPHSEDIPRLHTGDGADWPREIDYDKEREQIRRERGRLT